MQAGISHSVIKASASAEQEAAADEERQSGGEMWEAAEPLGGAAAGGLEVLSCSDAPAVHVHGELQYIISSTCCVSKTVLQHGISLQCSTPRSRRQLAVH